MEKIRFETDPHNRLIVTKTGARGQLAGFRRVLDGDFEVGKDNTLAYHVKQPLDEYTLVGRQIKFNGNWRLDKNHDLVYTIDFWKGRALGDELTLRARIIDVKENSLVAAVSTISSNNTASVYMLTLGGTWQADSKNRLTFRVNGVNDRPDILTFDAAWEVDRNNELLYRYQKEGLKRGERSVQTLRFKGHWDIRDKSRLTYLLGGSSNAGFEFKTGLGVFTQKTITHEIGIGVSRKGARPVKRAVTLYGSWKLSPKTGFVFEVQRQGSTVNTVVFRGHARLSDKNTILVSLANNLNHPLGAEVELTHQILASGGQSFLRVLASKAEQGVYIGLGRSW